LTNGIRIKIKKLHDKLELLDIDEGIRIESSICKKIFINRNASGIFIVQFDDSKDFRYFDSALQVIDLIRLKAGRNAKIWIY
jgi:hypothetical protein